MSSLQTLVFCGLKDFINRVERLKEHLKSCRKAPGVDVIHLSGERSRVITREKRMWKGIPVDEKLWSNLMELKRASVKSPKRFER